MSTLKTMLLAGAMACAPAQAFAAPQEAPIAEVVTTDAVTTDAQDEPTSEAAMAEAKAKMQKEIDEAIKLVEKVFGTDKLPPIAPAQLALAETTTGALVPPGSLEKMIDNLYGKLFRGLLGEFGGMSDLMLSIKTGVESEKIEALDAPTKEAIADIFDPHRKAREEKIMTSIKPIVSEVLRDFEEPTRAGMARAFARKFSADQLTQMNAFFATPAGQAYASEWMALQADPEVILAIIKSVPPMANKWIDRVPELEGKFKDDLPKEKQLGDLSDAELTKLAKLMKVDVKVLKEQRDMWNSETTEATAADDVAYADAAAAEAGDAADAATAAADAAAADWDPAYERDNWSEADRQRVEELEAASDAAATAAYDAQQAAIENARKRKPSS